MLDNCDVAILAKVNQLLERYGISACDVVVTAGTRPTGRYAVVFETGPVEPAMEDAMARLTASLGMPAGSDTLAGNERTIYKTLSEALACAPRNRQGRAR